jgi:hypothetical protein
VIALGLRRAAAAQGGLGKTTRNRTLANDRIAGASNRRRPITLPSHPGDFVSRHVPPLPAADAKADDVEPGLSPT